MSHHYRPPFTNLAGVTHAFVDPRRVKAMSLDLAPLRALSIPVLKAEYIPEFIAADSTPPFSGFSVQTRA